MFEKWICWNDWIFNCLVACETVIFGPFCNWGVFVHWCRFIRLSFAFDCCFELCYCMNLLVQEMGFFGFMEECCSLWQLKLWFGEELSSGLCIVYDLNFSLLCCVSLFASSLIGIHLRFLLCYWNLICVRCVCWIRWARVFLSCNGIVVFCVKDWLLLFRYWLFYYIGHESCWMSILAIFLPTDNRGESFPIVLSFIICG